MLKVDANRVSVRNVNVSKMHTRVRGDIKVKYTFTLEQATKAQRRSRGIALLFL